MSRAQVCKLIIRTSDITMKETERKLYRAGWGTEHPS